MRIVLLDYGYKISKKKGMIVIYKGGDKVLEVAPGNISEFIVNSRGVGFSSDVLAFLLRNRVPVYFVRGERLIGSLNPVSGGGNVNLRIKQFMFRGSEESLSIATKIVEAKIRSQRGLISKIIRNFRRREIHRYGLETLNCIDDILNKLRESNPPNRDKLISLEASAAKNYWRFWSKIFKPIYGFDYRRKRYEGAKDPINMSLNLLYTLLTSRVLIHLYAYGFDPYIGILHKVSPRRPALAMDIVEEFRVVAVDYPLIRHLLKDKPKKDIMIDGDRLSQEYKKVLINIYYKNLDTPVTFKHKTLPLKEQIDLQIYRLQKSLLSEDIQYIPYIFR